MRKSQIINTDEIQHYLKDLKKIPVVSHQRQEEIFTLLNEKKITKEEKQKLHDELVVGNLRFVVTVAKVYQNQGLDLLDLISEGNIGLLISYLLINLSELKDILIPTEQLILKISKFIEP